MRALFAALAAAAVFRSATGQILTNQAYVPARSPAELAMGDIQLRQAWEAAVVLAGTQGAWATTIAQDPALLRSEACLPMPNLYPTPPNPVGALYDVLTAGVLNVGFVVPAASQYTPAGLLWLDASGNGLASQYYRKVATALGAAYHRSFLGLNMVAYTDATAGTDALYAGRVHAIVAATTIDTYAGVSRGFVAVQSKCAEFSVPAPLYVTAASVRFANTSTLVAAAAANSSVNIGVMSATSAASLQGLLSNAAGGAAFSGVNITVYATPARLFADLAAGVLDAAYPSTYFANNATGTSTVRALTGSALGYMATATYFRVPVLDGATNNGWVPGTAPLVYPPVATANPLALGDVQIKAALAAATSRVIASGAWGASWAPANAGSDDFGYAPTETCANAGAFAYPNATTAVGAFAGMLSSGLLKVGYYSGVNLTAYNGALLSGLSNGGVVMGTGADYMTAIAAELSRAYGVSITVQWSVSVAEPGYPSAINNLWNLLLNRQVDALAPTLLIGGDVNATYARAFVMDPLPCDSYANPTILTVRSTETRFLSVTDLLGYVSAGNTIRIGAQTEAVALTARAIFGANAIITLSSAANLFAGLTAGTPTIDVVYRSTPPASLAAQIKRLTGTLSIATYTIFTRPPVYSTNTAVPVYTAPFNYPYLPASTANSGNANLSLADPKAVVGLAVTVGFVGLFLLCLIGWAVRGCMLSSRTAAARRASKGAPPPQTAVEIAAVTASNPLQSGTPVAATHTKDW